MSSDAIDCLLIHAPRDEGGESAFGMIMPMGLFALADILERQGHTARIVHLGLERIRERGFTIEGYLKGKEVRLAGISLHWFFQARDCVDLAGRIRSAAPDTKIVLGGFTASYFAREILETVDSVDFVIRGDGERPLLELTRALGKTRPDLSRVPNLTWRRDGRVVENPHDYVAGREDLDALSFTSFDLMESFSLYRNVSLSQIHCFYDLKTLNRKRSFPLCIGRGCSVNCSFCGGASLAQKRINNRTGPVFRSPDRVVESIRDASRAGYEEIFLCFDPDPRGGYFEALFRRVRSAKIDIPMEFTCWSLPTRAFIDDFRRTFGEGSSIDLSPETGSERLRRRHKGFSYSNRDLLDTVGYLHREKIPSILYFSNPHPFSTPRDVEETDDLIRRIKGDFGTRHKTVMHTLSPDPGSPMFEDPESYGMIKNVSSFTDYCNLEKGLAFTPVGDEEERFLGMFSRWHAEEEAIHRCVPRGFALLKLERYDAAMEEANRAIRLAPGDLEPYVLAASVQRRRKRYTDAIASLRKAQSLHPENPKIHFLLARYYMELHRPEQVREELAKGGRKLAAVEP